MYPGALYRTKLLEYGEDFKHNKQVYSLVDTLGDLGGLIEIINFFAMSAIIRY
jgi:hypothetical protein